MVRLRIPLLIGLGLVSGVSWSREKQDLERQIQASIDAEKTLRLAPVVVERPRTIDLLAGVLRNDAHIVHRLLSQGAAVNGVDRLRGWTALHYAAEAGFITVVDVLLSPLSRAAGLNIDQHGPLGWTPLIVAADQGYTDVVQALLFAGADPVGRDRNGWTALHHAADRGHTEVVRQFVEGVSRVDGDVVVDFDLTESSDGLTPLMAAVEEGHRDVATLLLGMGADPLIRDRTGWNAFHHAVNSGNLDTIRLLLEQPTAMEGVQVLCREGRTPLQLAELLSEELDNIAEEVNSSTRWSQIVEMLQRWIQKKSLQGDPVDQLPSRSEPRDPEGDGGSANSGGAGGSVLPLGSKLSRKKRRRDFSGESGDPKRRRVNQRSGPSHVVLWSFCR